MTQWNFENPGAGSVSSMNAAKAMITTLTDQLGQLRNLLIQQRETDGLSQAHWTGAGGDSIRLRCQTLESEIEQLADTLTHYHSALVSYVTSVEDIRESHAPLASGLDSAKSSRDALMSTIKNQVTTRGISDRETTADWREASQEVSRIESEIEALESDRRSADTALQTALGFSANSSFTAIGQVLVNAGVRDASELTIDRITEALEDMVTDVLGGDDSDLSALLTLIATEPEAAAALIESLGGTKTAELLDAIGIAQSNGSVSTETALDAAAALRSALSIASQDWTLEEAEKFTADLIDGSNVPSATLGYFFGSPDTAPMGEHFTVSVADQVDLHHRFPDEYPWLYTPMTGAYSLLENAVFGLNGEATKLVPDVIFETLALYPNAGLDWLAAGPDGDRFPRIEFWYGDSQPATTQLDEYDALSHLWASVQGAIPDVTSNIGAGDPLQMTLARVNSQIYEALCGNDQFIPELVSDDARFWLAQVQGTLLLQFAITPLGRAGEIDGSVTTVTLADGTVLHFPTVSQAQIAEIMGVTAATPFGAALMNEAIVSAQDIVTGAALAGVTYTPDDALNFVNQTQVLLDSAIIGSAKGIDAREQQRIDDAVNALSSLIDLVPIPGGPAGYVADKITNGLGNTFIENLVKNGINTAASSIDTPLTTEIIESGVTTWSETMRTAKDSADPLNASANTQRENALSAWVVALAPAGVDVTNHLSVAEKVDRLIKDDHALRDAYTNYATQED